MTNDPTNPNQLLNRIQVLEDRERKMRASLRFLLRRLKYGGELKSTDDDYHEACQLLDELHQWR